MKNIVLLSFIFLYSCQQQNTVSIPADLEGYEILEIPGTDAHEAILYQGEKIVERGVIQNGMKHGTWVTYHRGKDFPEVIANYTNGQLNGPYYKLNNRGQMALITSCLNGTFDGKYVEYKNSRPSKEQTIVNGQMEGLVIDYYNNGKKRSELTYKNGVLDGPSTYYNEKEEVSQEYMYKDGKMVE